MLLDFQRVQKIIYDMEGALKHVQYALGEQLLVFGRFSWHFSPSNNAFEEIHKAGKFGQIDSNQALQKWIGSTS